MRALKSITGHVIYSPAYTYKFQLKTTTVMQTELKCEKCDFTFKSPFYMHQHFEQVHGVSPILSEANQCFLCSAPFTRFCPFS